MNWVLNTNPTNTNEERIRESRDDLSECSTFTPCFHRNQRSYKVVSTCQRIACAHDKITVLSATPPHRKFVTTNKMHSNLWTDSTSLAGEGCQCILRGDIYPFVRS